MALTLVPPTTPPSPATPKKSLSEIFNAFAADAVERFPHLKGRFMVADMGERKVYGHKELDEKKTGLTPRTAQEYLNGHDVTKDMSKNKGASSCALHDPKHNVNVIFINEDLPPEQAQDVSAEAKKHLLFVLDHELAHCGIKDGFSRASSPRDYNILLGESVADAYALIRHYQRYGVDSNSDNKYIGPAARADNFVLGGDAMHFTSFVLDAIAKRKHEVDFDKLTVEQTAELARRFALEYMPPQRALEDLYFTFKPIRDFFMKKDPDGGIKALIEKALDPNSDYYTFKMASLWVKPFLEKRVHMNDKPLNLPKDYLDNAQAQMGVREAKFAKEDILFNMPTKSKAPFVPKLVA